MAVIIITLNVTNEPPEHGRFVFHGRTYIKMVDDSSNNQFIGVFITLQNYTL